MRRAPFSLTPPTGNTVAAQGDLAGHGYVNRAPGFRSGLGPGRTPPSPLRWVHPWVRPTGTCTWMSCSSKKDSEIPSRGLGADVAERRLDRSRITSPNWPVIRKLLLAPTTRRPRQRRCRRPLESPPPVRTWPIDALGASGNSASTEVRAHAFRVRRWVAQHPRRSRARGYCDDVALALTGCAHQLRVGARGSRC